jgi:transposase
MKKHISMNEDVEQEVVGLDLSDRTSTYVVIAGSSGEIVREGQVVTSKTALNRLFGDQEPARIAIEAGTHSAWVARVLGELGHEVIVANPRQVALIARGKRKNDRLDALALARLARVDTELLYPISHRGEDAQLDLALLRSRDFLVTSRTRLINYVRSLAKSVGGPLPRCSSEAFPHKAQAAMPAQLQELAAPFLEDIAACTKRVQALDRKVESLVEESYPEARRLQQQLKGVGPLTSLAFVLTLEEPTRFESSRDVGAYLGLVPGQRQSGARDPGMRITKAGDVLVRKLLVQAAHYILGPYGEESDLRSWGLRLAGQPQQGGDSGTKNTDAKKRAVTAVARKLAVLMHHLWREQDTYIKVGYQQRRARATA